MSSDYYLTLPALMRSACECDKQPPSNTETMSAAHNLAADMVSNLPVYGRSTGVGANKTVALEESNSIAQDLRLLRSHAVGAGARVDHSIVRTAIRIRANQLLRGGAGISPDIIAALDELLHSGRRPVINDVGSLGTGDLSQMSELALTLIGEEPTDDGVHQRYWTPHGGDALAFISSGAFTLATAAHAVTEVDRYIDHYVHVAVTTMSVVGANLEPFANAVQFARPEPGQETAATLILETVGSATWEAKRLQDSFGFRALTPVLAALLTTRNRLARAIEVEINSSAENPLVDLSTGRIYHNGNFHTQQLSIELESALLALFGTAQLSLSRVIRLSEPEATGLQPFLADPTPGSSGVMMAEYVAASALNELRIQAQPSSLSNVTISRGSEDHAPFTAQAARQLLQALKQARRILAVELLDAGRGHWMAASEGDLNEITSTAPYLSYIKQAPITDTTDDRPLSGDLAALERFVATDIENFHSKDTSS